MAVKRWLGISGIWLLILGVFSPLVSVFGLTTDYYNHGDGDGSVILVLVVLAIPTLVFTPLRYGLWVSALLSLAIIIIDFVDTIDKVRGVDSLEWGWIPLFGGAGMLIVSAALPKDGLLRSLKRR
jgi:hypothetical protein